MERRGEVEAGGRCLSLPKSQVKFCLDQAGRSATLPCTAVADLFSARRRPPTRARPGNHLDGSFFRQGSQRPKFHHTPPHESSEKEGTQERQEERRPGQHAGGPGAAVTPAERRHVADRIKHYKPQGNIERRFAGSAVMPDASLCRRPAI